MPFRDGLVGDSKPRNAKLSASDWQKLKRNDFMGPRAPARRLYGLRLFKSDADDRLTSVYDSCPAVLYSWLEVQPHIAEAYA